MCKTMGKDSMISDIPSTADFEEVDTWLVRMMLGPQLLHKLTVGSKDE